MSESAFEIDLVHLSGSTVLASVRAVCQEWSEVFLKTEVRLEFRWSGGEACGVDSNYYWALCRVREQLAQFGFTPRCYGACRNLVLTGMCGDSLLGEVGYLVRLGEPAQMSNLVNIFDAGSEMDLVSVAEQALFKEEWLKTIRSGRRPTA